MNCRWKTSGHAEQRHQARPPPGGLLDTLDAVDSQRSRDARHVISAANPGRRVSLPSIHRMLTLYLKHQLIPRRCHFPETNALPASIDGASSLDFSAIYDLVSPKYFAVSGSRVTCKFLRLVGYFSLFFIGSPVWRQMIWTTPKYNLAIFDRVCEHVCQCVRVPADVTSGSMTGWCTASRIGHWNPMMDGRADSAIFSTFVLFDDPKTKPPICFRLFCCIRSTCLSLRVFIFSKCSRHFVKEICAVTGRY